MGIAVYRMEGLPLRAPLLLLSQLAAGVLLYGIFSLVFQRDTLGELRDFYKDKKGKSMSTTKRARSSAFARSAITTQSTWSRR